MGVRSLLLTVLEIALGFYSSGLPACSNPLESGGQMKNANVLAEVLETATALSKRILLMVSVLALVTGCATATKQPSLSFNQSM